MYRLGVALVALAALVLVPGFASCSGHEFRFERDKTLLPASVTPYPAARFAVFSDPHIYSPTLGFGAGFQRYLDGDRKLLRESVNILEEVITALGTETADFVIVSGDLTKDGELASHALAASLLSRIEGGGKPVYVVPGNHDILNPHAVRYDGDTEEPTDSVTAQDFARIYGQFGFDEALRRDTDSLSYLVEPVDGLWLLALDSCLYRQNEAEGTPVTDGAFSNVTLAWIESALIEAGRAGKAVISTMHHNLLEHFKGQDGDFEEYVLDKSADVARLLANYNVRLVFTGHYHAQDIVVARRVKGRLLYDIETGSLVTYPNPYRFVQLEGQKATISTRTVTSIPGYETGFPAYARQFLADGITEIAVDTMAGYGVKGEPALKIARQVAAAFVAHYAGDERLAPGQVAITSKGAGFVGWVVVFLRKGMVQALWRDLEPADNNVTLELVP